MQFGGYLVQELLGKGGMGSVYLGRDVTLNRPVAIKVIEHGIASDDDTMTTFLREARLAARINHPNVVQIYGAGLEDGRAFMALEYVPGGPLSRVARRLKRFPLRRACEIVRDVARGLEAAHEVGIVHRDVKPGNILLGPRGVVKIADFGIAVSMMQSRIAPAAEFIEGTPRYLAPEQCLGEQISGAADLFALGVVLFELVAGIAPFGATNVQVLMDSIVNDPAPPLGRFRSDAPAALGALVARLLEKDPGARLGSAGELAAELDRLVPTLPQPGPEEDPFALLGPDAGAASTTDPEVLDAPTRATPALERVARNAVVARDAPTITDAPVAAAPSVLVVDDSPMVLAFASRALKKAGFRVTTSTNPLLVAAELGKEAPDVLLLDVNMPGLPGPSLVQALRSYDCLKGTRVVLYSSTDPEKLAALALGCGAVGSIPKSLEGAELAARLRGFLERPLATS